MVEDEERLKETKQLIVVEDETLKHGRVGSYTHNGQILIPGIWPKLNLLICLPMQ